MPVESDDPWWVIRGSELLDLLRRCRAGEDPDLVYVEAYANTEQPEASDGD